MPKIQIDGRVYIGLAIGLLFLPFSWLTAAILAAGIHECCHLLAAKCCHVSCSYLRIDIGGAVMGMQSMDRREEAVIAMAGPCGSFLLVFFLHIWPQIAVCGLVQGIFNLLPVYPLDGGRIAYCMLGKRCVYLDILTCLCILLAGITGTFGYGMGWMPLLLAVAIGGKVIQRKFPCKAEKLGVQ